MTFWDHLEVLRWTVLRVVIALAIIFIGVFIGLPYIFDDIVLGPARNDFFIYRWFDFLNGGKGNFNVDIININVASQFLSHVSTSFWFALVLVFPYLTYEAWKFISPALYRNEKRGVRTAFVSGTFLFFLGCLVGYCLVFPLTFRFLAQYQLGMEITNHISLNSYLSNFLTIIFVMGVVFEFPMLAWILSLMGILKKSFLKKYRRHAIVILVALSAVITPSGDPFTLTVVFLPLYLLYEVSILIVKE